MMRPLLDPVTRNKVVFCNTVDELDQYVPKQHVPAYSHGGRSPWKYEWPLDPSSPPKKNHRTAYHHLIQQPSDPEDEKKLTHDFFVAAQEFEHVTNEWTDALLFARSAMEAHSKKGSLIASDFANRNKSALPSSSISFGTALTPAHRSSDGGSVLSSDLDTSNEHPFSTTDPIVPPTIDSSALAERHDRCRAATLRLRINWIRLLKYRVGLNMWRCWNVLEEDGSVTWTYPAPLQKTLTKTSLTAPKWEKTKDERSTQPLPPGPGVMRFMLQANKSEIQRLGGVQSLSSLTSQLKALQDPEGKPNPLDDHQEDYWSLKPVDLEPEKSSSVVRQAQAGKPVSLFSPGQTLLTKRWSIEPFLVVTPMVPHVEDNEPVPHTVSPSWSLELSSKPPDESLPNIPFQNSSPSSQLSSLCNHDEQEDASDSDDSSKPSSGTSRHTFGHLARESPLPHLQSRRWDQLYTSLDLASVQGKPVAQSLTPITLAAHGEERTLNTLSKSDSITHGLPTTRSLLSLNPSLATGIDLSLYPLERGPVVPRRFSGRHRFKAGLGISMT